MFHLIMFIINLLVAILCYQLDMHFGAAINFFAAGVNLAWALEYLIKKATE